MRTVSAVLALFLGLSVIPATATPMRTAAVGDRMGSLVVGMSKIDSGRTGQCGDVSVKIFDYIVPGRPLDEDHASFIGAWAYDRLVVLVAFDEGDLTAPLQVYADLDGKGVITDTWTADDAPNGCELIQRARQA